MTAASPPLARMPAATCSHISALRLDTTTFAPCSATRSTIARPMPLLEPVTTATLPVISNSDDILCVLCGEATAQYACLLETSIEPAMHAKRKTVYQHADLTRLLHPASVAVIGASTRAGSFGERVLMNLRHYGGRTYPVNARYERIGEQQCYPNVAALPEVP